MTHCLLVSVQRTRNCAAPTLHFFATPPRFKKAPPTTSFLRASPRLLQGAIPSKYSKMARDGKDKKGRGGPSREVQISKAMSLLLRHAAEKEGLKMNAQGYANVADVV